MHGWVFSRRKMRVSTDVNFCGLALHTTSEGNVVIKPTKDRLAALLDFPSPQSKKEVKSLVGLLNTFSKHIPRVSSLTAKMQELTKDRAAFLWTEEMEEEMENVRAAAASALPLRPFNLNPSSQLYTDASHQGLGFSFTQVDPDGLEYFVCVGSTSTSPAMINYTVLELELQAIVFALN